MLTIFSKSSIIEFRLGSEYASANSTEELVNIFMAPFPFTLCYKK